MGHGLRCRQTMFTKQLSHRVGNLDPQIVAPRGRAGRANSKKDPVTGPIEGFVPHSLGSARGEALRTEARRRAQDVGRPAEGPPSSGLQDRQS
jgi:hypothetical protein